jgi:hypothetical protein
MLPVFTGAGKATVGPEELMPGDDAKKMTRRRTVRRRYHFTTEP